MTTAIRIRGVERTVEVLDAMRDRLRDMSPILAVVGDDLKTFVDDRFDTSTDPKGSPWQPLAPKTIARRRQNSSKPLVDTARLRNSIAYRATPRTLSLGTNTPYAGPHQFGAADIPRRAFLPFNAAGTDFEREGLAGVELERVIAAIKLYITDGVVR
jgi:phage gpG-like protein